MSPPEFAEAYGSTRHLTGIERGTEGQDCRLRLATFDDESLPEARASGVGDVGNEPGDWTGSTRRRQSHIQGRWADGQANPDNHLASGTHGFMAIANLSQFMLVKNYKEPSHRNKNRHECSKRVTFM